MQRPCWYRLGYYTPGQALSAEDLVFTLSHRLLHLEQLLATLQWIQHDESSNRRGPHSTHCTGDTP